MCDRGGSVTWNRIECEVYVHFSLITATRSVSVSPSSNESQMSAQAALQHQLHHPPPDSQHHLLPSPAPLQPQQSTPSPPAPPLQDKSLSPGPQHIPQDVTTIIDPATQLNASLDSQPKLPETATLDQQQHQEVKTEVVEPTLGHINGTIELVEHAPGTITIEEATNPEEPNEWVQEGDQMKRVKVRLLPPLPVLSMSAFPYSPQPLPFVC